SRYRIFDPTTPLRNPVFDPAMRFGDVRRCAASGTGCSPQQAACAPPFTPARRGRGGPTQSASTEPRAPKHVSMTWMQRLKRVFAIDIDRYLPALRRPAQDPRQHRGPEFISYILSHLQQRRDDGNDEHHCTPVAARAPPQLRLL